MPYIGTSPSNGVRRVHTYTATASQTTFSGASSEGVTLSYADTNYLDVFQNGVLLGSADYTSTSGTSVVLAQGASADDLIVIVVYDVFSVADTVSKTNGGSFDSGVTMSSTLAVTGDLTVDTSTLYVDSTNNRVGVGTVSPSDLLELSGSSAQPAIRLNDTDVSGLYHRIFTPTNTGLAISADTGNVASDSFLRFDVDGTERAKLNSAGNFFIGTHLTSSTGIYQATSGSGTIGGYLGYDTTTPFATTNSGLCAIFNRHTSDGTMIEFKQDNSIEGTISVSGTTVSYNGGHLSRWSQLTDNTRDNTLVKGTVMTNLDQMAEWTTDGVTEDNEQLNCMAVSSVEGDANVAGVFVNWDDDDDVYTADMNIAMTGDMVIRIAQGTTVARGDLLMSAGDGTAKPQDDDIVRSKTIAKVTSTNVSHTYDDGTYLVPCVLMAC